MTIKLLVADPHQVFYAGLKDFLSGTGVDIVGYSPDGLELVEMVTRHEPDVVLLSVQLGREDGIAAFERIKQVRSRTPVIMVACYDHAAYLARAHSAGAAGFLLKDFNREKLVEMVRAAAAGQRVWTREDMRRITGVMTTPRLDANIEAPLTPREAEVLRQMTLGHTNRRIADDLGISYETVKEHVQHILDKVGVEDRTQAAVWAVRHGLA